MGKMHDLVRRRREVARLTDEERRELPLWAQRMLAESDATAWSAYYYRQMAVARNSAECQVLTKQTDNFKLFDMIETEYRKSVEMQNASEENHEYKRRKDVERDVAKRCKELNKKIAALSAKRAAAARKARAMDKAKAKAKAK